jgi:radical SAM protein with 4Fe4S-binding SPASM domain
VVALDNAWRIGPTHVDFNVTNGCNLACSHCHSSSGDKLPDELSTNEICDVLDELHRMGVLRLAIAGGEPFIRRDILEILEHACRLPGWQVAVITNGLFFRSLDRVEELATRCPGLTVNVSLDGSTPTRFGVLRKQAHRPDQDPTPMFTQIIRGIQTLVTVGVHTAVNVTLSRPTLDDCVPTYRLTVDELGASALVGIKFFPGGYGRTYRDLLELPFPVWSRAFADLTRAKLVGQLPRLQISVPAAWEFYLPLVQAGIDVAKAEAAWGYRAPLREHGYRMVHSIGDTAGIAELAIAGDGTVYPSVLSVGVDGMVAGNVRTRSLAEIWASSPIFTRIRAQGIGDLAADCGDCALATVCGGGSRTRAYAEAGNISAADYACPIVHPTPLRPSTAGLASRMVIPTMHVLGQGHQAVRVFFTEQGCQVRANGHIVSCDGEQARLLRAVLEATDPAGALASARIQAIDLPVLVDTLTELLSTLERLGASTCAMMKLRSVRELAAVPGTRR